MSRNLPTIVPDRRIMDNAVQRAFLGAAAEQVRDMHRFTLWVARSAMADMDRIIATNRDKYDSVAAFTRHAQEELIWAYQQEEDEGAVTRQTRVRRERAEKAERMRVENDFADYIANFEVRLRVYISRGIWDGVLSLLGELDKDIAATDEYWQAVERETLFKNKVVQEAIVEGYKAEKDSKVGRFDRWMELMEAFS